MKRVSAGLVTAVVAALPAAALGAFGDADPTFGTAGLAPLRLETVSPAPNFALGMRLRTDSTVDLVATSGNSSRFELATMHYGVGLNRLSRVRAGFGVSSFAPSTSIPRSGGGFVTAGIVTTPSGQRLVVVRTTASGALDLTFGSRGVATMAGVRNNYGDAALAFGPSGTIVVANAGMAAPGAMRPVVHIRRLTSSGARDRTFGSSGTVTVPTSSSEAYVSGLAVATNGKVTIGIIGYRPSGAGVIMRRTASGALDTTFDGDGIAQLAPGVTTDNFYPSDLAIQPDNRVTVLATDYTSGDGVPMAYRLNTNGRVDATFGMLAGRTDFVPSGSTRGRATRIIRRANGHYAVITDSSSGVVGPALGRTDGNGKSASTVHLVNAGDTFSPTVMSASGAKVALAGQRTTQSQIAIMTVADSDATGNASVWGADQPGGSVRQSLDYTSFVVADRNGGSLAVNKYGSDLRIVALDAAGKPNTAFGGGFVHQAGMVGNGSVTKIRRLADGRVAVAINSFTSQPHLVIFTASGQLDTTFAGGGDLGLGANTAINDVIGLPNGTILLGMGYRVPVGRWGMRFVRVTANGAYDTSFAGSGIVELAPTAGISGGVGITHLHVDATGYVGTGGATDHVLVARVSTSGVPDTTIGAGTGLAELPVSGLTVEATGVDAKNRTVFAGSRGDKAIVLRLNTALSVDTSFSGDGIVEYSGPGLERAVGVARLPDSSLVIRSITIPNGGGFPSVNHLVLSAGGLVKARRFEPSLGTEGNPRITADGRILAGLYMSTNLGYETYLRRLKGLAPVKPVGGKRLFGRTFRVRVDARGLIRTTVQIQALRGTKWKVIGARRVPATVGQATLRVATSRRVTDHRFRAVVVNMSGSAKGVTFSG